MPILKKKFSDSLEHFYYLLIREKVKSKQYFDKDNLAKFILLLG